MTSQSLHTGTSIISILEVTSIHRQVALHTQGTNINRNTTQMAKWWHQWYGQVLLKKYKKKTSYGISTWTQYFRKRATNIKKRFLTLLWHVTCSFCNRFTFFSFDKYFFFTSIYLYIEHLFKGYTAWGCACCYEPRPSHKGLDGSSCPHLSVLFLADGDICHHGR